MSLHLESRWKSRLYRWWELSNLSWWEFQSPSKIKPAQHTISLRLVNSPSEICIRWMVERRRRIYRAKHDAPRPSPPRWTWIWMWEAYFHISHPNPSVLWSFSSEFSSVLDVKVKHFHLTPTIFSFSGCQIPERHAYVQIQSYLLDFFLILDVWHIFSIATSNHAAIINRQTTAKIYMHENHSEISNFTLK